MSKEKIYYENLGEEVPNPERFRPIHASKIPEVEQQVERGQALYDLSKSWQYKAEQAEAACAKMREALRLANAACTRATASLKQDKERLDWLMKNCNGINRKDLDTARAQEKHGN